MLRSTEGADDGAGFLFSKGATGNAAQSHRPPERFAEALEQQQTRPATGQRNSQIRFAISRPAAPVCPEIESNNAMNSVAARKFTQTDLT
jgi:hypothetical protein